MFNNIFFKLVLNSFDTFRRIRKFILTCLWSKMFYLEIEHSIFTYPIHSIADLFKPYPHWIDGQ